MNSRSTRLAWLAGVGVGATVSVGTQNALWGLAVGLTAFFLVRWLQPRASLPLELDALEPRLTERETSIEVVCKTVTPARQEWVSLRTGRLYDVLSADGLAGRASGRQGQSDTRRDDVENRPAHLTERRQRPLEDAALAGRGDRFVCAAFPDCTYPS